MDALKKQEAAAIRDTIAQVLFINIVC